MIPTKFQVNCLFGTGEETKQNQKKKKKKKISDGHHGGHLQFPIGTILPIFDVQVTLNLSTKLETLPFQFRRSRNTWIFKMATLATILDFRSEKHLAILSPISHFDASYQVSSQLTFSFRTRIETDGGHGGHFGFSIETI